MSGRRMKVSKCPSDALTMTNRAVVSPSDFDPKVRGGQTVLNHDQQGRCQPLGL